MSQLMIRPPRVAYSLEDLGPKLFNIKGSETTFERQDLHIVNERGLKLECSHFRPANVALQEGRTSLPCVVYLHGNCGSRRDALYLLGHLLPRNITVFCFDFAGAGLSEGDNISLGHYEEQDLSVVIEHLRSSGSVSAVALWGRSMGAATAVLRAAKDPTLAACVFDSPFSSLMQVASELVSNAAGFIPEVLTKVGLQIVRSEIQAHAKFDIEDVLPIKRAPYGRSPALFAVSEDDEFMRPSHTYDLYKAWGGEDRDLMTFAGGHNSARPRAFLENAASFLESKLCRCVAAAVTPGLDTTFSDMVAAAVMTTMAAKSASRRRNSHCKGAVSV